MELLFEIISLRSQLWVAQTNGVVTKYGDMVWRYLSERKMSSRVQHCTKRFQFSNNTILLCAHVLRVSCCFCELVTSAFTDGFDRLKRKESGGITLRGCHNSTWRLPYAWTAGWPLYACEILPKFVRWHYKNSPQCELRQRVGLRTRNGFHARRLWEVKKRWNREWLSLFHFNCGCRTFIYFFALAPWCNRFIYSLFYFYL